MSRKKLDQLVRDNLQNPVAFEITTIKDQEDSRHTGTRRIKNAKWINIDKIYPDPSQPRKTFKTETLAELAGSIQQHGIRQPIVVEYMETKEYFQIVHGERRYRAAQIAGLNELPCIVQDKTGQTLKYAQQLVENIQREDLSPIDKARALLEYKEELGAETIWTDVEKMVGISESRRKQFVALLKLPAEMQKEIVAIGKHPSQNSITEKHARGLLMLKNDPDKQQELYRLIKNSEYSLTGDETIEKAKSMKGKKAIKNLRITYTTEDELIKKMEKILSELKRKMGSPG